MMTTGQHDRNGALDNAPRRILFVDDEPRILQGIRRMLRSRRREWHVETAESGQEALARMAQEPFGVVVTDMRMPEMDGTELLAQVRDRFPGTIRIVLSGYADKAASLRSLLVAHQFASKPFAAEDLVATLDRACSLSDLIHDEKVRRVVGAIELLPEPPQAYLECVQVLEDDENAAHQITRVIEKDPSLAAKILQVVNSAFFGLPQHTSDLERAVTYLGTETVKSVVLALGVLRTGARVLPVGSVSLAAVTEASVASAQLTRRLHLVAREQREQLYTAALLHDIGYLALLTNEPESTARASELSDRESMSFDAARRLLGDPCSTEAGAYLLGAWGLPLTVVEAVRDQHGGEEARSSCPVTAGVHLVDRAVKIALQEASGPDAFNRVEVDPRFVATIGETRWQELLEMARSFLPERRSAA